MEREMRLLGLSPCSKKLTTSTSTVTSVLPTPVKYETRPASQRNQPTQSHSNKSSPLPQVANVSFSLGESEDQIYTSSKPCMPDTSSNSATSMFHTLPGREQPLKQNKKIESSKIPRRYSLDSSLCSKLPPCVRMFNGSTHANSFVSSLRQSDLLLVDGPANTSSQSAKIENESIIYEESPASYSSALNSSLCNSSSSSFRRRHSMPNQNYTNYNSSTNTNLAALNLNRRRKSLNNPNNTNSRKGSIGRVELNQLEIPTVYMHNNVGYERYKQNPHFYLPDGTLKRKYSLPKLSESLEAVKDCTYLRRYSYNEPDDCDVINIFKDSADSVIANSNDLYSKNI